MRIVDSPGVVFDEDDFHEKGESSKGSILLRNVVKVEDVDDPVAVGKPLTRNFSGISDAPCSAGDLNTHPS